MHAPRNAAPLTRLTAARAVAPALALCCGVVHAAGQSAAATDVCVVCSEPEATYVCRTEIGTSKLAATGAKVLCMSQLANRFGHARCKVVGSKADGCLGEVVVVDPDHLLEGPEVVPIGPKDAEAIQGKPASGPAVGAMPPPTAPAAAESAGPFGALDGKPLHSGPKTAAPAQNDPDAPPRTVEELAKKAAESSKEGLEKAGTAVGDAAKKTWNCLTSLLSNC